MLPRPSCHCGLYLQGSYLPSSMLPMISVVWVMLQVNGGSQSFNTVNTLRVLGRWMRMITIPNQSSVPKAWTEFHDDGRMKVLHMPGLFAAAEGMLERNFAVRHWRPYLCVLAGSDIDQEAADAHLPV